MPHARAPRRARSRSEAYRQSLWLLTSRDLRVRYSTSFLGYFWSVLEPLVMAVIYWFVFTQIVQRIYLQSPRVHDVTYNGVAYANYYTAWIGD